MLVESGRWEWALSNVIESFVCSFSGAAGPIFVLFSAPSIALKKLWPRISAARSSSRRFELSSHLLLFLPFGLLSS